MALETLRHTSSLKLNHGGVNEEEKLGLGLGFVRFTRGLGRKRVGMSNEVEKSLPIDSTIEVLLLKMQCSERMMMMMMMIDNYYEKFALESLSQDVFIRIICGVDHEDLKQIFNTVIAKQLHFAYSTPRKTKAFRTSIDLEESSDLDEIEAPNASRQ